MLWYSYLVSSLHVLITLTFLPCRCYLGDGENDVEMFKLVKYSVAVENARQQLKDVATFVTDSSAVSTVQNGKMIYIHSK